ncbi:hypothetical protein HYX01_04610 [Candidatus Woesearchaeota archaeon]|nr:hypothetical protein [Candidatus Woesearchaeota archaeon]
MIKMNPKETEKLFNEGVSMKSNCNLCKEACYEIGKNTGYGTIIYRIGNAKNGWFATLSPKTGGNPKLDFTIQLMPLLHLTHFSQVESYHGLGKNFGAAFSKICRAMTAILMDNENSKADSEKKELSVPIATYGKCTTWKEKKEHLHIKIFPFRNAIGQPYTVDSSFEKKEVFKEKNGKEFVKMEPVKKAMIEAKRFNQLAKELIGILKVK